LTATVLNFKEELVNDSPTFFFLPIEVHHKYYITRKKKRRALFYGDTNVGE
jgi:hypothetical protein